MFDIEEVVFKLGLGLFNAGAVLVLYLGPPSDSRPDTMSEREKWNIFLEQLAEVWAFRAWSHQAHFTPQHIENLRQFVEPILADDAPDASYSLIISKSPNRPVRFRILPH